MRTGKAVFTLMLLSPVLAELLTASIPIVQFLSPGTFIFLLTLGYGIPVLLIRELAVRWQITSAGIFILGIAYGILNEGFWAKTFLLDSDLPLPGFGHYGYILGISFPWAVTISFWHALV